MPDTPAEPEVVEVFRRRFRWPTMLVSLLIFALLTIAMSPPSRDDLSYAVFFFGLFVVFPWLVIVRPRIEVFRESVAVTQWNRSRQFNLVDVVEVETDYWGGTFTLLDGSTIGSSMLGTWNLSRWFGFDTRADRFLRRVLNRARALRGGPRP